MSLVTWVDKARQLGASDLHLETEMPPVARVRGELRTLGDPLPAARLEELLHAVSSATRTQLLTRGSADVSMWVSGVRCRMNIYRTSRGTALAARLLVPAFGGLRAANLHPSLRRLVEARSGLVLVAGPGGSGKSTTLGALVEEINATVARHIITLESPLEQVFGDGLAFIRQREIPTHSPSFEQALNDALCENPDVLVVSQLRTPEVMRLALEAAESGHLVLAAMHSASCAEALGRICKAFPAEAQEGVRTLLADCLTGVICQRLDYLERQQQVVPRCEVLIANTAAQTLIRTGQLGQLAGVIQGGSGEDGMWSFERYQRWMEQKQDWLPPPAPAQVREERALTLLPHETRPGSRSSFPSSDDVSDRTIEIVLELDDELEMPPLTPPKS